MFDMPDLPLWHEGEETANMITHLIGMILAIFSIILLLRKGRKSGDRLQWIGNLIFSISMIVMYATSTVYHGMTHEFTKKLLRYGDHISIFLLIAGSYTPFTLTTLRKTCGFAVFITIWTMAIAGIILKILFFESFDKYSLYFFIAMGWVIVFAMKSLIQNLPRKGLMWLIIGGLFYTIGCYFYSSLEPFYHAIWHVFVIIGSICHFICVYFYT